MPAPFRFTVTDVFIFTVHLIRVNSYDELTLIGVDDVQQLCCSADATTKWRFTDKCIQVQAKFYPVQAEAVVSIAKLCSRRHVTTSQLRSRWFKCSHTGVTYEHCVSTRSKGEKTKHCQTAEISTYLYQCQSSLDKWRSPVFAKLLQRPPKPHTSHYTCISIARVSQLTETFFCFLLSLSPKITV